MKVESEGPEQDQGPGRSDPEYAREGTVVIGAVAKAKAGYRCASAHRACEIGIQRKVQRCVNQNAESSALSEPKAQGWPDNAARTPGK